MTVLLLWKEHLKEIYNKYSYVIRFVVRLLLILCTILSMNANIGYMAKLKNPVVVALLCFFGALLPDSGAVFLIGCVMVAHVYAVSMEMALITLMMILVVAVLYYGFKPGDSWLMILTPLAFLFKVPYAVAFLVGLGGSLITCKLRSLFILSSYVYTAERRRPYRRGQRRYRTALQSDHPVRML